MELFRKFIRFGGVTLPFSSDGGQAPPVRLIGKAPTSHHPLPQFNLTSINSAHCSFFSLLLSSLPFSYFLSRLQHRWLNKASCQETLTIVQGGFFDWSAQFSVPKLKTMGSQSEILFHEILDVQKILVG